MARPPVPRSYEEISRHTVPGPDGSFRPSRAQEAEAIAHRRIEESERDLYGRIKEALMVARDLVTSGVFIEVDGTRVTLRGRVLDRRSMLRVEELVSAVDGVTHVDNLLVVGND